MTDLVGQRRHAWGTGWTKIAVGLPDHMAAEAALDAAIVQQVCQ
ncbi:MAG: hypothetical protein ABSE67_15135 [Xanthobacteraceae bacterium]